MKPSLRFGALVVTSLGCSACLGFSIGTSADLNKKLHRGNKSSSVATTYAKSHSGKRQRQNQVMSARTKTIVFQESSYSESRQQSAIPTFVYRLNASTKWLVTVANTLGIWLRMQNYEGPFIVVGSILAVYLTEALKQLINHDRPEGAPFTDPGMPSSHSLVSFFMAAAWSTLVLVPAGNKIAGSVLACTGASIVAILRVVCGYHSYDQIGVGALLGSTLGWLWARLGHTLHLTNSKATFYMSWSTYMLGSALFVVYNMRDWLHRDRHL